MDYSVIYKKFIESRRGREDKVKRDYHENHHIIPKSLGGSHDADNMISLTASDHLFAHKLLALIFGGPMWHALHMCNISDSAAKGLRLNRHWFERVRRERAIHMAKTRSGQNHHFFGKKFSKEHRDNLSIAHMGKYTGKDNPTYDHKVYDFRNKDGSHKRMTKGEFINYQPGIPSRSIYAICSGAKKSAHGWYVSETEICERKISGKGEYSNWFNPKKYKFKHDSGIEACMTQNEFLRERPELNQGHVSAICRGARKSHKGWRVVE